MELVSKPWGGHTGGVNTVAFSPDGIHVASGFGSRVNIWDAGNGDRLQTLELNDHDRLKSSIRSVAFTRDGAYIISGYSDRTVRIWVVRNGAFLEALEDQGMFARVDTATSCLCTESGILPWQPNTRNNPGICRTPQYPTYELNADGTWVTCNGKNVLWLPPDYRRSCPAATSSDMVMAIGVRIGWVLILNFSHKAPL